MGSLANPRLAAAVADAGAQGMVSVTGLPPAVIVDILDGLREQTRGVFGVNFICQLDSAEDAEYMREAFTAAAPRAKVIDCFYGWPDPSLVDLAHRHGALVSWQVGSKEEAIAAVEAGCDFIVAQGIEAGGHIRGRIGLLALLSEVLDAVRIPVVAAGGIGNGRAMAAALAAGADAVRVGTRFVAAEEAEAHPTYVAALIGARAQDTVYTEVFSVGWPDAPHRVLRASLDAAQRMKNDIIGERVNRYTGTKSPIRRFEVGTATTETTGAIEAMPQWAGESVSGVQRVQKAAEIVRELAEEAEALLRRWGDGQRR